LTPKKHTKKLINKISVNATEGLNEYKNASSK